MANFKLVLFDIDGTLLDHAGVVKYGISQALISVYGTAGEEDYHAEPRRRRQERTGNKAYGRAAVE
jgi:FMN phosphatase YigB (HAD superfamily)